MVAALHTNFVPIGGNISLTNEHSLIQFFILIQNEAHFSLTRHLPVIIIVLLHQLRKG